MAATEFINIAYDGVESWIDQIDYNTVYEFLKPDYAKIVICFYHLVIIEQLILVYKRGLSNMKETLSSLNHGVLHESVRAAIHLLEMSVYYFIYNITGYYIWYIPLYIFGPILYNTYVYFVFTCIVWCGTFVLMDFCCYWLHRYKHEIHLLWTIHQVHHSSQLYELPVAVRLSVLELFLDTICFLPFAIIIHPYYIIGCRNFIYIYQLWLHTELIDTLGPLERIFNTPYYHRIHHRGSKYCIETNYGAVLIIWDRKYNTLQKLKSPSHTVIFYGLPINSTYYDTFYQQVQGFKNMIDLHLRLQLERTLYITLFYGPYWHSRNPEIRLGTEEDKRIRNEEDDRDTTFDNYWQFHYVCFAHYMLVLNGLLILWVKYSDYTTILHAFYFLLINFYSYNCFYDNSIVEAFTLNIIRHLVIYFFYNDLPYWSVHIYETMFLHDLIYFMIMCIIPIARYFKGEFKPK